MNAGKELGLKLIECHLLMKENIIPMERIPSLSPKKTGVQQPIAEYAYIRHGGEIHFHDPIFRYASPSGGRLTRLRGKMISAESKLFPDDE